MADTNEIFEVPDSPVQPTTERARRAVVLAAGRSRRLSAVTADQSKAFLRLGGISLVERAVACLLSNGVDEVIIVVGAGAASLEQLAHGIGSRGVRTLYADRWKEGNGASLAAAEPELSDDPLFIVMAADHVFADGALCEIAASTRPSVLVDERPNTDVWAEGTRVRIEHGNAVAFSKELDEPAVDCGVFVLSPAIFEAQRGAAAHGDATLAGAVSRFAGQRPLRVVSLPRGVWWHDIDTPGDVRAARASIRRSLAKRTDGPVARLLNRPISTRISMAISSLRPDPGAISVIALLVIAGASGLLATGAGIAGGLLVQAGSILDGVDGEVARVQHRATAWGALIDGVLDRIGDTAVVAGLAVWALNKGAVGDGLVLGLAVAGTAGCLLSMATKDRVDALRLIPAPESRLNYLLGGRDARLLVVAISAVIGEPVWALAAIVVTTSVTLVTRLAWVARRSFEK